MAGPESAVGEPQHMYRTVSISEVHYVGKRRRPFLHVVRQEIEALSPCRSFPFYFDTRNVVGAFPEEGCRISGYRGVGGMLRAVDVTFPQELQPGEHAAATIRCSWVTPRIAGSISIHEPECRRQVGDQAIGRITMAVSFHQEHVPNAVWAAEWSNIHSGTSMQDEKAELVFAQPPANDQFQETLWAVRHVEDVQPGRVFGIAWKW